MSVRRVVTGHKNEKAVFVSDEDCAGYAFSSVPGMIQNSLWATENLPRSGCGGEKQVVTSLVPPAGGSRLSFVTLAPDSAMALPTFDPSAAAAEFGANLPGLAQTFEPENPGMHRTPTLDYVIVLSGSVVLELDDGAVRELKPTDVVIQNGTRHGWRNPSSTPATLAVVMIGQSEG
ncbi:hypothetical protein GFPCMMHI_04382 [Ensifer adhaerens]|nr:hypothetical protein [Ensifer adhaerens]